MNPVRIRKLKKAEKALRKMALLSNSRVRREKIAP
jgi:hypothetical protein